MQNENPDCEKQRTLEKCECENSSDNNVIGLSRFIDLTRDYGFKIVMTNEDCPELMLEFLNAVIPEREIVSIRFLNTEMLPSDEDDHRSNYDVLCVDSEGNRFITEMQKEPYDCFSDRLIVYSGGQTDHLLKRGRPYTEVHALYVISILGSRLNIEGETDDDRDCVLRRAGVTMLTTNRVLSDKLNFIFLQLPAAKRPTKDSTFIEKWAWYVREMVNYEEKPLGLDKYFDQLFEASNRDNIEKGKLSIYDKMIRDEIQIAAEREYAVREGRAEGRAEGLEQGALIKAYETARKLKAAGIDIGLIAQCTGLTPEQVNGL